NTFPSRRPPRNRVYNMVLYLSVPNPAPAVAAARRKAARHEPHAFAARDGYVDPSARGQIAPRGNEPRLRKQLEPVVDRLGLHDAVQVELHPCSQEDKRPNHPDTGRARRRRGPWRAGIRRQRLEVTALTGRL